MKPETVQIRVLDPRGLHHFPSGFQAWEPGTYEFPADPAYAGWLQGHLDRGGARLVSDEVPEVHIHPEPGDEDDEEPRTVQCQWIYKSGRRAQVQCGEFTLPESQFCRMHQPKEG